ncbi:MAG TPA: O-antigen ligase family protein [bacterium]|nr:O-antigen ligase family protein [bacterium]
MRVGAIRSLWQPLSVVGIAVILCALAVSGGGRDPFALIATQGAVITLLAILVGTQRICRLAITLPLLGMVAAVAFTSIWTVRFEASVGALLNWTMYLAIALTIASTITSLTAARRFLDALVVIASGLCLFAGFIFWGSGNPQMRWYATFYWPNPFAGFLLLTFPLALVRFLHGPRLREASSHGVTAAVLLVALVFTYSRGAWIVVGAVVLSGVILLRSVGWRAVTTRLAMLAAFAGLVVIALPHAVAPVNPAGALASRATSIVDRSDYSIQGRLSFWRAGLEIFRDHPLVGTGPGTFGSVHAAYQTDVRYYARDPHNFYIQIMTEMGVVGLGALLLLGSSIWTMWGRTLGAARGKDEYPLLVGVGLGVLAFSLHSAFDMDWMFPAIPAMAFGLIGVLAWYDASTGLPSTGMHASAPTWTHFTAGGRARWWRGAGVLLLVSALAMTGALWMAHRDSMWGQEAAQRHDWPTAIDHYAAAARWAPFSSRNLDLYAWALIQTSASPQPLAADLLRRAMRVDRMNGALPLHLALVLSAGRSTPPAQREAEELLRHALELDRFNRPDIYRALARLYRDEGRDEDAARVYREATNLYLGKNLGQGSALYLILWPDVVGLFQDAAAFSTDRGDVREATQFLERLLADDPTVVDAVLQLSALYVATNRTPDARALLEATVRRNPSDPRLANALNGLR